MEQLIIKEYLTAIKLDEENKLLSAYDIKDSIIDEQSEGILSEVNELMYQKISSYFLKSSQRIWSANGLKFELNLCRICFEHQALRWERLQVSFEG